MCCTKVLEKQTFYLIFPSLSNEEKEDGEHILALSSLNFEMCKWLGEFDIVWKLNSKGKVDFVIYYSVQGF